MSGPQRKRGGRRSHRHVPGEHSASEAGWGSPLWSSCPSGCCRCRVRYIKKSAGRKRNFSVTNDASTQVTASRRWSSITSSPWAVCLLRPVPRPSRMVTQRPPLYRHAGKLNSGLWNYFICSSETEGYLVYSKIKITVFMRLLIAIPYISTLPIQTPLETYHEEREQGAGPPHAGRKSCDTQGPGRILAAYQVECGLQASPASWRQHT